VREFLDGKAAPSEGIRLQTEAPLRWIAPGILRPGDAAPARRRLLLWTDVLVRVPTVLAWQDGHVVGRRTLPWPASPGRVFRVPSSLLDKVNPSGGAVVVSLR
jgi:hypothetical protein